MRAHLYRPALRLQRAKRAGALALAVFLAVLDWQSSGEPPRYVVNEFTGQVTLQHREKAWVQIVIMIVAALVSYALAPRPPKPKPAALEDFDIPQSKEGQSFTWVFGEVYIRDATVGYWGGLSSAPIKAKGGKK